jgi:hypothetical protein
MCSKLLAYGHHKEYNFLTENKWFISGLQL